MTGVGDQGGGGAEQAGPRFDDDDGQVQRDGDPETPVAGLGVDMMVVAVAAMTVMIMTAVIMAGVVVARMIVARMIVARMIVPCVVMSGMIMIAVGVAVMIVFMRWVGHMRMHSARKPGREAALPAKVVRCSIAPKTYPR